MSDISITKDASEKVLKERDGRCQFLGRQVVPRLAYYHRSYSKLDDGRTIEYGSGFVLSFIECSEVADDKYLRVELDNDYTVNITPAAHFRNGSHCIDWDDRKFTLASVAC